jgi:hypothetical protein
MPNSANVGVTIDWSNGPSFGNPLLLNSGILNTDILANSAADVVDISDITLAISIRRGRNRILNKFEAGTATVVIGDSTGDWNPSNALSIYYGKLVPLRKIRIWADYDDGFGVDRYYLFSGYITNYDTTFGLGVDDVNKVTIKCVDGFRLLNSIAIDSVPTASTPQLSGLRINTFLDVVDFPSAQRQIDTGNSIMQSDPGVSGRDLLAACQLVENSEFGGFFMSATGDATFYSRDTVSQKADETPTIFSDDGVEIGYQQISFANDDSLLVNDVSVTRLNGVLQNVSDQTSIDAFFLHSGKRDGILVQTDAESLNMAHMLLVARKDTTNRLDSMTINVLDTSDPDKIVAGLDLEIFDLINVTKSVPGGSTITKELFIQGVEHDISVNKFTTKFLTSEPLIQAFILNSTTTQGKLGSGILSY